MSKRKGLCHLSALALPLLANMATADTIPGTIVDAETGKPQESGIMETLVALPPQIVSPSYTVSNSSHVANGVGLRNARSGVIELSGMPADAVVSKAYLYWGWTSLTGTGVAGVHDRVLFAPMQFPVGVPLPVKGKMVGTGADTCWFGGHNAIYRADVTKLVSKNGLYGVGLIANSTPQTDGNDPWVYSKPPTAAQGLAEGASLVVIYSSLSNPTTGTTLVYDQGLSGTAFSGSHDYGLTGIPSGTSYLWSMGGLDGQIGKGLSAYLTGKKTFINGVQVAGPGSSHDTDADWNGSDGNPLNQLHDTRSHLMAGTLPGTATIQIDQSGDCLAASFNVLTIHP